MLLTQKGIQVFVVKKILLPQILFSKHFFKIFAEINFRGFELVKVFAGSNFRGFGKKPRKTRKLIPAKISSLKVGQSAKLTSNSRNVKTPKVPAFVACPRPINPVPCDKSIYFWTCVLSSSRLV